MNIFFDVRENFLRNHSKAPKLLFSIKDFLRTMAYNTNSEVPLAVIKSTLNFISE